MNEGLLPRRYAKALYQVAVEKKADAQIYDMMKTLVESFSTNPELSNVLGNPYVANKDKAKLLTTASGAGKKDVLFADFLKLLERNKRLNVARGVALAYVSYYRQRNGIYDVHVTSAAELSSAEEKRLRAVVERHLTASSIEFEKKVDSSLIGGFVVQVGNERIDASVSNELKQLRLNLITK